ncbi:DNA cytosine methyltransferase [Streptomyces sp. NBC_01550]|uniref:DNA cytosine methyltransferase n=1 Tax=Streptomyces sp. NBC_01550 TaxID=2975875 RepID=UPI00386ABC73
MRAPHPPLAELLAHAADHCQPRSALTWTRPHSPGLWRKPPDNCSPTAGFPSDRVTRTCRAACRHSTACPVRPASACSPRPSGTPHVQAIDWHQAEPVCVLTAGFPCQDLSVAGPRTGLATGTRSGLWRHVVDALNPCLAVIENVRGLLSTQAGTHALRHTEPCPRCLGDLSDQPCMRALGVLLADLADPRVRRELDVRTPLSRRRPAPSRARLRRLSHPARHAACVCRIRRVDDGPHRSRHWHPGTLPRRPAPSPRQQRRPPAS